MRPSKYTQELFRNSLIAYKAYINSLPIPNEIKATLQSDGINHASFYLFYPHLFKEAFTINQPEKIDLLSIAGFLFYKSLIYVDKIVDSQAKDEKVTQYYQLSLICQEEAIKILATLFPLGSDFWKYWNKRKGEYLAAQKADRNASLISSPDQFYDLADYKSSFGKVAIDSLAVLSKRNNDCL